MNKLISLSSEGKFSIIDSVVEKVSTGSFGKKQAPESLKAPVESKTSTFELVSKPKTDETSKFEVIEEEINEDEALEEIKEVEKEHGVPEEVVLADETEDKKIKVELKIKKIDMSLKVAQTFTATCHCWFIVKDQGEEINWRRPLVQKSQITS